MNFRTTIVLIILLAGALVFVFVANRGSSEPDSASAFDSKGKKLFTQKTDDVTKVAITPAENAAHAVVLQKQDGKWRLTQPVNWLADEFESRNLVESILDLRSQGTVDLGNSAILASTGLDHPHYTIEVTDLAGKTTKIQVGSPSALGSNLYVKVGDEKGGQLVSAGSLPGKLDPGIDKLAASLRDKQLVKTATADIRQLTVSHKDRKLSLQKDGDAWQIIEPRQAPGDSSQVSDVLFAVTGLRADEFIDPKSPDVADAQFDKPKVVVTFSTAAPAATKPADPKAAAPAAPVTVTFGQFANVDRDKIFVKLSEPSVIAKVAMTPASLEKLTDASVLSLRDRKAVDIDPAHVDSFTLAVSRPATTQPTTRPADNHEYTIARRKEVFGPLPPPAPATRPAPAKGAGKSVATTQPATLPATRPLAAATQPASKWVFKSGGNGDADEGQVQALLDSFHPLRAEKYLEQNATTRPVGGSYVLTIHSGSAAGHGPQDHLIRITSPGPTGPLYVSYQDLTFEADRSILEKLEGDMKTPKKAEPPGPSFPGGQPPFPGGHPPFPGE